MQFSLILNGLTKHFGRIQAVDSVSANIPAGSIYGFLGPNGAGKTTTIRMIMSILFPDAGSIQLLGSNDPEAVKDRLGYLPEEKGLYKKMKVAELITYFGRLKGMNRSDAHARSISLLNQFELGEWTDKKCDTLSKGMSQKVQIIATLIHRPELVILDEPFSGLDPINVEVVREVILELKREGKTVIFSTHVMEQAEQICDYILLINKGRKILDGPLAEIKDTGRQTISVDYEGDGTVFNTLPHVTRVNDMGRSAELSLAQEADPQHLLQLLSDELTIRRFDLKEPSLHEIFVRSVRDSTA
jgi:ABC-2 type transport system ATP-binding protein